MPRKRPIETKPEELNGGVEWLVRKSQNIAPFEPFDLAEAGPERLIDQLIIKNAAQLPHAMIRDHWDEEARCFRQFLLGPTGNIPPSPEQLAWLLLVVLADLFGGRDPNWKVKLQRRTKGRGVPLNEQLDLMSRNMAIIQEIQHLENDMPRSAAVSLVAEQRDLSERTIYEILSRASVSREV